MPPLKLKCRGGWQVYDNQRFANNPLRKKRRGLCVSASASAAYLPPLPQRENQPHPIGPFPCVPLLKLKCRGGWQVYDNQRFANNPLRKKRRGLCVSASVSAAYLPPLPLRVNQPHPIGPFPCVPLLKLKCRGGWQVYDNQRFANNPLRKKRRGLCVSSSVSTAYLPLLPPRENQPHPFSSMRQGRGRRISGKFVFLQR